MWLHWFVVECVFLCRVRLFMIEMCCGVISSDALCCDMCELLCCVYCGITFLMCYACVVIAVFMLECASF